MHSLLAHINNRFETKSFGVPDAIIRPRVIYERRIVLQRKTWQVPKEKLPLRTAAETDWNYFLRVQLWRRELQIPDEVFITGSYYKPQYVAFNNPILVAIFESCARNCSGALQIKEMLPSGKQLATTGGRVVEFLAQWDRS